MRIFIIMLVLLLVQVDVSGSKMEGRPDHTIADGKIDDNNPLGVKTTKEEKGILSSLITMYVKFRENVRYVYDEIQYWKSLRQSFVEVKDWFKEARSKVRTIKKNATQLFSEPGDLFTKMDQLEEIFNRTDDLLFRSVDDLNHRIRTFNYHEDRFVRHSMEPIAAINNMFQSKRNSEPEDVSLNDNIAYEKNKDDINNVTLTGSDEKIVEAVKQLSVSILTNSDQHYQWAENAVDHYNEIDKSFDDISDDVLSKEMSAAWYNIEASHANVHRIYHSIEELKVISTLLGVETWSSSVVQGALQAEYRNGLLMRNALLGG